MHPQSALARAAPEFVTYTQLVRTAKRPYMTGELAVHLMHSCSVPFRTYLMKGILCIAVLRKAHQKGGICGRQGQEG